MLNVSPFLIIGFYTVAVVGLFFSNKPNAKTFFTPLFWIALLIGLTLHFSFTVNVSYVAHSFNFSVASMSLWISALVVSTFVLGSFIYPIKNLAIIVLPLSILSIAFALFWGDQQQLIDNRNSMFYWHIGTAVSAFTLLTLSVLQALLFGYQELALRKRMKNVFLTWLPPIQTMENVLFRCVILGFILLSIAISLGSIYNFELNQTLFTFNHHTVLAIMSWLGFAILLYGRIKLGWRGIQAINWTLIGFLLLGLGYFGTKMISELILR